MRLARHRHRVSVCTVLSFLRAKDGAWRRLWRGRGAAIDAASADVKANDDRRPPDTRRRSMSWAQRLKRVLLRASCPPPFGPAFGCSQSLQAIVSAST